MKKQILKGVAMLASIVALSLATALVSAPSSELAQSGGPEVVTIVAEMK